MQAASVDWSCFQRHAFVVFLALCLCCDVLTKPGIIVTFLCFRVEIFSISIGHLLACLLLGFPYKGALPSKFLPFLGPLLQNHHAKGTAMHLLCDDRWQCHNPCLPTSESRQRLLGVQLAPDRNDTAKLYTYRR